MKIYSVVTLMIGVFVFTAMNRGSSHLLDKSQDKRESTIMYTLMGIVDYLHFKPKEVDNTLSKEIWKDYINQIDPAKRFFIQSEINSLKVHEGLIDNEIDRFEFGFFDKVEEFYIKSVDRSERIFEELIDGDFDLSISENYEIDGEKMPFAKDELELRDNWRKFLKYNIVSKVDAYMDNQALVDSLTSDQLIEKAKLTTRD